MNKLDTWKIDIIDVKDPWNFSVRKVVDDNDDQPDEFRTTMDSMAEYLNMVMEVGQPIFKPAIGEICAAQKRDGTWHRVCVKATDTTDLGRKMKCYLIDLGVHQTINPNRLRKLPPRIQKYPAQVYHCQLHGVRPLMLVFDETETGLKAQHLPTDKWDPASVKFMHGAIEASIGVKGQIVKNKENNNIQIKLLLRYEDDDGGGGSRWLCLNDELVTEGYASYYFQEGSDINSFSSLDDHSSFASHDSDCTTPLTSKNDCSGMPSLSLCSESESEYLERRSPCVRENLKRSQHLSPNKIFGIHNDIDIKRLENVHNVSKKSTGLSCITTVSRQSGSTSSAVSSGLQKDKAQPNLARGRASLNQILTSLRPGGLSATSQSLSTSASTSSQISTTTSASDTVSQSALVGLRQLSNQKSKPQAAPRSVSFSDGEQSHRRSSSLKDTSLSPISTAQSSSTPSSSSSSSSLLISSVDNGVKNSTPNGNNASPPQYPDSDCNTTPDSQKYIGTGARPKVRFSTSPSDGPSKKRSGDERVGPVTNVSPDTTDSQPLVQPRHRKNLANELMMTGGGGGDADKVSLVGRLEGQRLLQHLRKKSGLSLVDTETSQPKTNRPDKAQVFFNMGTFAYGKGIPLGVYNVMDYPFVTGVKKVLNRTFEREMAQGVEAYVWPSILAGRNVVGVTQASLEMAYIPPLLSLIANRKDYMSLPHKMGPLVLVVVPSWRRAREVYDFIETFTGDIDYENKQTRTIALYAGGTEECPKTEVALIRGCEILVSTPGSLLRTMTGGVSSLKRICHLVLDSADILTSRFQDEISNIMQMYTVVVKDRRDVVVPQQVSVFSRKWTEGVDNLRLRYTKLPILSFSSRLEASIYGDVKQVVVMCRYQQRLSKLSDLIDSLAHSGQRIITWTSEIEDAKELAKTINSRGVHCLLTHHGIESDSHIEEIKQRWFQSSHSSNKLVVLVATDPCYEDLSITDATTVIHYDMPISKTRFGNRLACMHQHFSDRLSGFKSVTEPVSHVILTEKSCPQYAQSFFDMLKRCKSDSYQALEKYIQGYVTGLQTKESNDLCPFIKSFGFCLNEDRCDNRHVLVPERDLKTGETTNDTLPVNGEVKLKVIHVVSANHFYCRLLEHRLPDNSRQSLREEFQELTMKLALFFSKESNHVPYLPPQRLNYLGNKTLEIKDDEAGLCGFKTDDGVHRAKVVGLKEGTRAVPMKRCRVWLVDSGCYKTGTIDDLVKLPQSLAEVPYQAVEVFLCRIKPIDKEAEWTDRADIFVNELVKDKVLIGRIVLRLGVSMWLDPLVHQVVLKKVGPTNDMVIRQEILSNNFASPNPEHLQRLCEMCRGKVDIPEVVMQRYFDYCLEMELTQESFPPGEDFYDVNIAAVTSPGLFYIQRWDRIKEMEELEMRMCEEMDQLDSSVDGQEPNDKSDTDLGLGIGSVGVAKSNDDKWYRVKIIAKASEDVWEVLFLDYGDMEEVPHELVRPLPREYAKLPCQAIECEMANLEPAGQEWSPEAVDILCDLSYFVDGEKKKLSIKVHHGVDQSHSLAQRLVVDVYECQNKVWYGQELVWRRVAKWNGDDGSEAIKPILEKPALKNQLFFNPWDKVPYLCANIYWAREAADAYLLANELNDLLSKRTERWDSTLIERNLFHSVVQIIGYVSDPASHGVVLDSLVKCCLDSDKLCEAAINENLVLSLSLCLEQVSRQEIQSQAAQAVASLLASSRFLDAAVCLESVFIDMLLWNIQKPLDLTLLDCCCKVLCLFIEQDRLSAVFESQEEILFTQILECLVEEGTREDRKKPWLHLLATLAQANHLSINRKLLKESTIKLLIQLLKTLKSSACLSNLVLTLRALVDSNRKYKMILLEAGLQPIVRQVCNKLSPSPEKVLCQGLLASLTLQFPAQEGLAGRRIEEDVYGQAVSTPPVAWTETCFKVQLKVKVKNASVDDFEISRNNLKCSAESEGTLFHLDWDLYGNVIPSKSRVEPQASYTIISLRKQTEGKWGRLLKQKNKPPNLSPDFDYLCDSDEDEEDDDENSPGLTKKRKGIFENLKKINAVKLYSSSEEESDELAMYSHSDNDEPKIDYDKVLKSCMAHK